MPETPAHKMFFPTNQTADSRPERLATPAELQALLEGPAAENAAKETAVLEIISAIEPPVEQIVNPAAAPGPAENESSTFELPPANSSSTSSTLPAPESSSTASPENGPDARPSGQGRDLLEFAMVLDQHKFWVESGGEQGTKADLCGANLEGADLTGVNLQGAFLHKARLRGADLSMANLRGASMVQADLRETNLLGAELRGANLMGATLYGADGLWVGRLGGTNLYDAMLPESIAAFDGANAIHQATRGARWLYFFMLAIAMICAVLVGITSDVRLILNGPALPVPRFGSVLPMNGFYLGAPIFLVVLYARFHFLLLRLWGNMAALPAVFQDGRTLEKEGPWYLMGLVRKHYRWLTDTRSPMQKLEGVVGTLLAYWAVPATLFFFWLRYLARQDARGSLLHIFLFVVAVAAATSLPMMTSRIVRPGDLGKTVTKNMIRAGLVSLRAALISGATLLALSGGVIWGLPAEASAAPEISVGHPLRWASHALRIVGFRPYAELTETTLVPQGRRRSAAEDEDSQANGAALNQAGLRYARAYRATLTGARLWRADLEGAYLTEADLRGANLRESRMRDAVLDHAHVEKAVLISAEGRWANLTGADLRGADLTYAVFENARFAGAKLGDASLYGANLKNTQWLRADLTRADLRDTQMQQAALEMTNLELTDFSGAKLGGARFNGAQFKGTILLGTDLRGTDLRGGTFPGAVLRDAAMDGAKVDGADLRGALGLTAAQLCSTSGWQSAQMDADVSAAVAALCSAK